MSVFSFFKKHYLVFLLLFGGLTLISEYLNLRAFGNFADALIVTGILISPLLNAFIFRSHLKEEKLKDLSAWNLFRLTVLPILLVNSFFYLINSTSGVTNFDITAFGSLLLTTFVYQITMLLVQFRFGFWQSIGVEYGATVLIMAVVLLT